MFQPSLLNIDFINELKKCTYCFQWKEFNNFGSHKGKTGNLRAHCKNCERKISKQYRISKRLKAFLIVAQYHNGKVKCSVTGCNIQDMDILQLNHINGGGTIYRKENRSVMTLYFDIINGRLPAGNFDIRCANHNIIYDYETGFTTDATYLKSPFYTSRMTIETLAKEKHIPLRCQFCPEDDIRVLTIEHMSNDGAQERRKIGGHKNFFYLINTLQRSLNDLTISCSNCQWKRRRAVYNVAL